MADLFCETIAPEEPHTHTVVFLHGRGDEATHFCESLKYSPDSQGRWLAEIFPSFKWVLPSAELRACISDWGNRWSQWFDVFNVKDFSEREELQLVGLKESVLSIRNILAKEAAILGGRWDKIILAGISQGAATSTHTLINLDISAGENTHRRLGAYIGISCRMPFAGRTLPEVRKLLDLKDVPGSDEVLKNTPILLEHCEDDALVLIQHGLQLRDTLQGFGAQVEWKSYPTGGHWFNSPEGIDDAVKFLKRIIAEDGRS